MKRYIFLFVAIIAFATSISTSAQKPSTKGKAHTFHAPNFNYPQDVIDEADLRIDQALMAGNGRDLVRAVIQSTLAQSTISSDTLPSIIHQINDVIDREPDECIKASLYILEAKIYSSYYTLNHWKIENRESAETSDSSNVFEWNTTQFCDSISSLINKALSYESSLKATPITKYSGDSGFIVINDISMKAYPTMYDFIAYQAIGLYQQGPFKYFSNLINSRTNPFVDTESPTQTHNPIIPIYDNLLKFHEGDNRPYINAFLERLSITGEKSHNTLDSLYNQYSHSPECAPILLKLIKTDMNILEQQSLLQRYIDTFPKSVFIPLVECELLNILQPDVSLIHQQQYNSTDSIALKCVGKNIENITIQLFANTSKDLTNLKFSKSPIHSTIAKFPKNTPLYDTIYITLPPMPYNYYSLSVLLTDKDGNEIKPSYVYRNNRFLVSDLTTFSTENLSSGTFKIFTINANTGAPEKGVRITSKNKDYPFNKKTNANGFVIANKCHATFQYSMGNDKYLSNYYSSNQWYRKGSDTFTRHADIFTDLAIYRPGDTIHTTGVCYRYNTKLKEPLNSLSIEVTLRNSDNKIIATKQLFTDEMGRFALDFTAPTGLMNGTYYIHLKSANKKVKLSSSHPINVSEYKTPSFYVEFIDKKVTYPDSGIVTLHGKAVTFSGMPVANTPIDCTLQSRAWWGAFSDKESTSIFTDEMGLFTLQINTKLIKESQSYFTFYRITATATNELGETQSGYIDFMIGKAIYMNWDSKYTTFINDIDSNSLPVKVIDNSDTPVDRFECEMTLTDRLGNIVTHQSFLSDNPKVDLSSIPNGKYTLKAWLKQDSTINITQNITIFNPDKNTCPTKSALWVPNINYTCVPGNEGVLYLANSFDESHVYYTISCKDAIIKEGWLTLPPGVTPFRYTMPQESSNNTLIEFYAVKNRTSYKEKITIEPKVHKPKAILTAASFRDKITAGDSEKWTLHLAIDKQSAANSAIIAAMTDKAINSIMDNSWYFNPQLNIIPTLSVLDAIDSRFYTNNSSFEWPQSHNKSRNLPQITPPLFQLYNIYYFEDIYEQKVYRSSAYLFTVSDEAVAKAEVADKHETAFGTLKTNDSKKLSDVQVRISDVKTAFWKPMLTTDDDGNVNIEFEVPNMNTTWMFQAIGYDKHLNASTILKDVVSNKPLMVTANMPRFVRTGDNITLMGGVQNITDSTMTCTASIDIFNPINNIVYATNLANCIVKAKETVPVSIAYAVPDSVSAIAFRIRATNGTFGDGEQVMIPVLPSTSPVVESKPFYILPDSSSLSIKLPDFPDKAKVTFEYCDNPIWYVATALPVVKDNNRSTATGLAHALFAQLVANKIAKTHPQIAEALDFWKTHPQDSALVSMLSKNQELKIGSLIASPWITDSEEQTLRMSQLYTLFNDAKSEVKTKKILDEIEKLQQPNGGFVWFKYPNTTSSVYTTLAVAQLLGEIKSLDAIDENTQFNDITKKMIAYLDKEIINQYNKRTNKLNFSGFSDFAYTRSLFLDIPMSVTVKDLYSNITKSLSTEWQSMNIANKAHTAITLANFNQTDAAKPILESIDQFSIYRPAAGRYWDNFSSSWNTYYSKVTLTSLILQAYTKVAPQSSHIDQIRQWMLLEKQTTDWGNSSLAADAVYALLSSGNNWLTFTESPQFALNGKSFSLNSLDRILGYGKVQLDLSSTTNNILSIKRNANTSPAWGAVYAQYNASMSTVKASSSAIISIKKDVINLTDKELKVGDKVQIKLTITNSRNLEYVTLTDERAACLEPVEQISGYRYQDGTGYYLEIKDSENNIFFNYLPKGTHIITYETFVTNTGTFNCGIATIQCQYAPQITAHSAGTILSVK